MKYSFLFIFIFAISFGYSQSTTLGLLYSNGEASPGYTLFTPEKSTSAFLINNCGEIINDWWFTELPGATCYLLENGNILRAGKDSLEIRDWDSNLIWSYPTTNNGLNQHHDIHPMPNGNILLVVSDEYTQHEVITMGRDASITDLNFKFDKIVEIQPIGTNDADIVWEWRFVDHLIQDFDSNQQNYGIVEDHPELLDVNYDNGQIFDWVHLNAVEYNAEKDQVLITARHLSEIYIIDHSTTTEEAAGHSGGNSDKGGDFLWRWGNPAVYRQGTTEDQKLKWPHDAKWVKESYEDEGKISVFNNNFDGEGSESFVHLIEPVVNGYSYSMSNNIFLPETYYWSFGGELLGSTLFSEKKSGTHSLPNGNIMICEYDRSIIFEITKDGSLVWAYRNPVGNVVYNQYEEHTSSTVGIFRGEKYPPDYPGFDGKDLTPQGLLENQNPVSNQCIFVSIDNKQLESCDFSICNPIMDSKIQFNKTICAELIKIIDLQGKIHQTEFDFNDKQLNVDLKPGLYLLQIFQNEYIYTLRIVVQ